MSRSAGSYHHKERENGFTLIETLAVVALLAICATMLLGGLGRMGDEAKLRAAIASASDLDARARLMAQEGCIIRIVVPESGRQMEGSAAITAFVASTGQSGHEPWELVLRSEIPPGVQIELSSADDGPAAVGHLDIDCFGRSPDYSVVARLDGRTHRLRVAGLTGWSTVIVQQDEVR